MSSTGNRAELIVDEVLDLPAAQRAAYLEQACGGDKELQQMVVALFQAHRQVFALEERPAVETSPESPLPGSRPSEKPGDWIGRYKLLEQIGEGGCGTVYMSQQEEPVRRRVALKILKLGMDTKQVIGRFEAERQALALMDHPNIAKVLDAGCTETGRPYFVMDLVRGISVTRYCDEARLNMRQRLDLFIQVCQALQHAHQKGIIHRDLKPSNILVADYDGVAVPKVIDFGIAKATAGQTLTDKTLFTAFAQFIGTPAYMSPEQAKLSGLDIDTRSDVYSLGVLLYEILTGKTPFDAPRLVRAGFEEVCRIIREEDPPRPSTRLRTLDPAEQTSLATNRRSDPPKLFGLLHGDLDWIVMKTLEKDRSRRYATANALAMDLKRFLDDEPVLARPPSNAYRLEKLLRRHRLACVATAAVAVALVLGLGLSTWMFVRERASSARAKDEAKKSQQVADLLKDMLAGITPAVAKGQDTLLLRRILEKMVQKVGTSLSNNPTVMAELQTKIGQVYWALGEYPEAETNLVRAVTVLRKFQPNSMELADSLDILSQPIWYQGRLAEAELLEREVVALRKAHLAENSQEVATAYNNLGVILSEEGELDEAEALLQDALRIQRGLSEKDEARIAETLTALSSVFWKKRDFKKAEDLDREALVIYGRIRDELDPEVALTHNNLGTVLRCEGNFPEAILHYRKALEIQKKIFTHDHQDTADSLHNLAQALWDTGADREAEDSYRELLKLWTKLHGPESREIGITLNNLGTVMLNQGKLTDAETAHRQALELQQRQHYDVDIPYSLNNLATVLLKQKKVSEAEPLFRETIVALKKAGNKQEELATCFRSHTVVLGDLGRLDEAEKEIRECLILCEADPSLQDTWRKFDAMSVLGGILVAQKRHDQAEPLLLEGNEGLLQRAEKIPVPNRPRLKQTVERLVQLYETWSKPDQAAPWKEKLAEFDAPRAEKKPAGN